MVRDIQNPEDYKLIHQTSTQKYCYFSSLYKYKWGMARKKLKKNVVIKGTIKQGFPIFDLTE